MTNAVATTGAQQHAAMVNAIRAMGAIVKVKPVEFQKIVYEAEKPAIVTSVFKFFGTSYQYLTSFKGLIFFAKSPVPLELPSDAFIIAADKIWIPS